MNISELSASVYGTKHANVHSIASAASMHNNKVQNDTTINNQFSNILAGYVNPSDMVTDIKSDDTLTQISSVLKDTLSSSELTPELIEQIDDLTDSISALTYEQDEENNSMDVMSILTDAEKAKEYLSSKSGRQVIANMMDNQIAGIITGNQ